MTTYSHSRLNTFDQCKYKYKLQYIEKIKVKIPTTVEAFMGSIVHKALERLYKDLKAGIAITKNDLLYNYHKTWHHKWSDDILIVKKELTKEDYLKKGEELLSEYYDTFQPFTDKKNLLVETKKFFPLANGNSYYIMIDRLDTDMKGTYYVCDYKTGKSLPSQEELDKDKQLAMYSLWVRDSYPDHKKIVLKWYYLVHGKDPESIRTDEELLELKRQIELKIKEIEACFEFPTNKTKLCDWCLYKDMCPAFGNQNKILYTKQATQKRLFDY